jgi:glycosyltransferase involved in cell wall biosynthesis
MPKPIRHVAVNARFLLPGQLEGLGRFTDEVMRELVRQHPEVRFTLLLDRPFDASRYAYGPNVRHRVLFPQARHPLLYLWYFEHSVARTLAELAPDAYFSPDGYLSLSTHTLPQVPVFHDLAFEHYPQAIDRLHRWHYRTFFPRFAHHSARLLTVSDYTRHDIAARYGVPLPHIAVVGNGASARFAPQPPQAQQAARQRYAAGQPYFLYVGAIQPRKNVARLFRAFDQFKHATGHPAKLVVAGRMAWKTDDVQQAYAQLTHRADVVFTGFVPDADLPALYGGALALAYVSLFEGFGLPILEGFQAGIPALTSNTSSMPEVAGPGALLVDPTREADIAQGLATLATQPQLCAHLAQAGARHAQRFTWARTAQAVWQGLQQAVEDWPRR